MNEPRDPDTADPRLLVVNKRPIYEQRIRERQAVSDAFGRGEIDWQEYQDRLAALPKIRPRTRIPDRRRRDG